jgi:hypothetical protein
MQPHPAEIAANVQIGLKRPQQIIMRSGENRPQISID